MKTSDAAGGEQWAALYDYNVYFPNAAVKAGDEVEYEPAAVAATDINTVASAAGGFTVKQDKGLLAGEVHDCGDVRVVRRDGRHRRRARRRHVLLRRERVRPAARQVARRARHEQARSLRHAQPPDGPADQISAIGKSGGQTILLGTYIVQTFPGAVTALSFRGRRPWQK